MKPIYILILTFLTISTNAQDVYDYTTWLKGGYIISYKVDKDLQYLFLQKGRKTICELASGDKEMLHKNLGYVGADFKDYFVWVRSFGSGNPHYIQLIKKPTGKNLLKKGAAWIDVDEKKEIILYSDNDVPVKNDKFILYHIGTGQKKSFPFPNDIFDGPQILNRIKIFKLTETQLIIKYDTEGGSRIKMYSR